MKNILLFFLCVCFIACKKDAGKHCPVMALERESRHLTDLSAVSHLTQVMDTLNKYPELQATRVNFSWGYDPGSYSARIQCNVYYKNLLVFNTVYAVTSDSYGNTLYKPFVPLNLTFSTEPGISAERANQLAEETLHFDYCSTSQLGLLNVAATAQADYRLVWRIRGAENGFPIVDLDAQTGDVYYSFDGKRFID